MCYSFTSTHAVLLFDCGRLFHDAGLLSTRLIVRENEINFFNSCPSLTDLLNLFIINIRIASRFVIVFCHADSKQCKDCLCFISNKMAELFISKCGLWSL